MEEKKPINILDVSVEELDNQRDVAEGSVDTLVNLTALNENEIRKKEKKCLQKWISSSFQLLDGYI